MIEGCGARDYTLSISLTSLPLAHTPHSAQANQKNQPLDETVGHSVCVCVCVCVREREREREKEGERENHGDIERQRDCVGNTCKSIILMILSTNTKEPQRFDDLFLFSVAVPVYVPVYVPVPIFHFLCFPVARIWYFHRRISCCTCTHVHTPSS